jgi:hypothetical protein
MSLFPVGSVCIFSSDFLWGQPSVMPNACLWALSQQVKQPGREVDTQLHLVAMLRMRVAIILLPHVFVAWCLINHKDNFKNS